MKNRNRLLALLAPEDYALLEPDLEQVDLPQGLVLSEPGKPFDYCYFPFSGVISTVIISPSGKRAEIGLLGREGASPVSLALGTLHTPYLMMIQVPGEGVRITTEHMRLAMEASPRIKRLLSRWAHVAMSQSSFTALSNAVQSVEERLARWILMCHDRVDGDEIDLTHDFLATMLSVRRPSVTVSLHLLEGKQMIYSHRGTIIVRDREALEEFAMDSYGGSEREYDRLIGGAPDVWVKSA